jgi:NTE family protein
VGTSIGAVNAAFLAVHGVNLENITGLVAAWDAASKVNLLPGNYLWLSLRTIFDRPAPSLLARMRAFYIDHGLGADLKFGDIQGVQLLIVAADLNGNRPVLYGLDPAGSVLEGILASTAIPPWISPLKDGERLLIDGGVVSNLPVEPALSLGATQIIALDLYDPRVSSLSAPGFRQFLIKLVDTFSRRQTEMEIALALNRRIDVRQIGLVSALPIQMWDFQYTSELIEQGYQITRQAISGWPKSHTNSRRRWLRVLPGKWMRKDTAA